MDAKSNSREWYGWYFPELSKFVDGEKEYALIVKIIKNNRLECTDAIIEKIEAIIGKETAEKIHDAARCSIGAEILDSDAKCIEEIACKVVEMIEYRDSLSNYLHHTMQRCAPNLLALLGESVMGARLLDRAGGLSKLAQMPASTVQIIGAEKALFRALKMRHNTPKYGLIFHSQHLQKGGMERKGQMARFLSNKISIAARIDAFSDTPTSAFGNKLREQVDERLVYIETGELPRKNDERGSGGA